MDITLVCCTCIIITSIIIIIVVNIISLGEMQSSCVCIMFPIQPYQCPMFDKCVCCCLGGGGVGNGRRNQFDDAYKLLL